MGFCKKIDKNLILAKNRFCLVVQIVGCKMSHKIWVQNLGVKCVCNIVA